MTDSQIIIKAIKAQRKELKQNYKSSQKCLKNICGDTSPVAKIEFMAIDYFLETWLRILGDEK